MIGPLVTKKIKELSLHYNNIYQSLLQIHITKIIKKLQQEKKVQRRGKTIKRIINSRNDREYI